MDKPAEQDIRALFSYTANFTREWVEDQLGAKAELVHGGGTYIEGVEWDEKEVFALVYSRTGGGCSDEYHGQVTITEEELVDLLTAPESMAEAVRKKQEADRIAAEAKRNAVAEARRIRDEAAEKAQYLRLKAKYEDQ